MWGGGGGGVNGGWYLGQRYKIKQYNKRNIRNRCTCAPGAPGAPRWGSKIFV